MGECLCDNAIGQLCKEHQMDQKIFRYELDITARHVLSLPGQWEILSIAPSRTTYAIDLWAKVTPGDMDGGVTTDVAIQIFGTGHPIPADLRMEFIGTAIMSDGLVWHVFRELASMSIGRLELAEHE